jgi:hypothetical protein
MSQKNYLTVTGLLFTIGAIFHLLRLVLGWSIVWNGYTIPTWLSLVGVAVAGYLAYSAYKLMH